MMMVFVASECDVGHNDDGICKIILPYLIFLLITPHMGDKILYTK